MMTTSTDSVSTKEILYINFNQTAGCLTVGSKTGYTLYDITSVRELSPTFESRNLQDVCIIERNFSMSLVAYVTLDFPRNLVLYNYQKDVEIFRKLFPNTVLSVHLNRNHVVVCLEEHIYILNARGMNYDMHIITHTTPNPKGLVALSWGPLEDPSLLAYPGNAATGEVQIFDCSKRLAKITIPAHESALAALALDEKGERLATASIKGTVIRVFSVTDGNILFEFRRGVKRCAEVSCLSFSKVLNLLCMSSNTETIHIFKLDTPPPIEPSEEEGEGWMEMFGRVLSQSARYLPTQVSDVLTQQRAFAYVHMSIVDQKTTCAITHIDGAPYVLVASLEGFMYCFSINTEVGGECHLVKQFKLDGPRVNFVPPRPPPSSLKDLCPLPASFDATPVQNDTQKEHSSYSAILREMSDGKVSDNNKGDSSAILVAQDISESIKPSKVICVDLVKTELNNGSSLHQPHHLECNNGSGLHHFDCNKGTGLHHLDCDALSPLFAPLDP